MPPTEHWTAYDLWLPWIIRGFGFILIYIGLAYDSGTNIQHYLESLWIRIDDLEKSGIKRRTAFVRLVASTVTRWFNKLFGVRLLSFHSVGTSIALTMITILLSCLSEIESSPLENTGVLPVGHAVINEHFPSLFPMQYTLVLIALAIYVAAILRNYFSPTQALVDFIVVAITTVGFFSALIWINYNYAGTYWMPFWFRLEWYLPVYFSILVVSIVSDVLFIAFTRYLLATIVDLRSFVACLALLVSNVLLGVLLVFLPYRLYRMPYMVLDSPIPLVRHFSWRVVTEVMGFPDTFTAPAFYRAVGKLLMVSNYWDGIVASVAVILAIAMLTHLLLWPTIARPLYLVASEDLKRHRVKLVSVGFALIVSMSTTLTNIASAAHRITSWP